MFSGFTASLEKAAAEANQRLESAAEGAANTIAATSVLDGSIQVLSPASACKGDCISLERLRA